MSFDSEAFLQQLLETFRIEAQEHINNMRTSLLDLEKLEASERHGLVERVFREAHSLKGAARAVDMADVEQLCQSMESIFAKCKQGELALNPDGFDVMHQSVDLVENIVNSESGQGGTEVSALIKTLQSVEAGEYAASTSAPNVAPPPTPEPPKQTSEEKVSPPTPKKAVEEKKDAPPSKITPPIPSIPEPPKTSPPPAEPPRKKTPKAKSSSGETIRISTAKLDALLLQVQEMLSVKLSAGQRSFELSNVWLQLSVWQKESAKIREQARLLDKKLIKHRDDFSRDTASKIEDVLAFLKYQNTQLDALQTTIGRMLQQSQRGEHDLGTMIDGLLDDMKQILMHPFALLLDIFPKMIRDLSRAQGKKIDLNIEGADIEIDRRILEEMRSPLIHLLRNSVDHGIEAPDERIANNKAETGTINITVSQVDATKVKVTISDDGKGIDTDRLKNKAVQQGILTKSAADALDDEEATALIFQSALSTSKIITEISGRGLGMAIVQEKTQNMGGDIIVASTKGLGTVFEIVLPTTIATFRGVLLEVVEQKFIIPTLNITRVANISAEEIKTVENRETIVLDGEVLPVVSLAQVLELPANDNVPPHRITLVVLSLTGAKIAFSIDKIINEQEVLVKGLGAQLSRVRNVAGVTILGSGDVVPILNVPDLYKSATHISFGQSKIPIAKSDRTPKSILVVDDSLTSRSLLRNILDASGYIVETSVDGVDAFTTLRTQSFDILISDVEMPRMNGFELTAKVRADEHLKDLPIVLVTSLASKEDKERGIDAGANAYVIKSNFDQTKLLEIISRLIG